MSRGENDEFFRVILGGFVKVFPFLQKNFGGKQGDFHT